VKFFRDILKISYETGRRLRSRGILVPDAFTSDGRALYLVNPQSLQRAREQISQYRALVARTRYNLCPKNPLVSA
jgi:hypothetical protein